MASWLFGISKLKTDHVIEKKDTSPELTTNLQPEKNLLTQPHLPYDLQPTTVDVQQTTTKMFHQNIKPISMLDNIPFVLSDKINETTNYLNYNLEDTKNRLLSVKKLLESDDYNYDFSKDRQVVSNIPKYYVN